MVLKLSSRVSVEFNRQGHIIPDWTTGTIQTILLSKFLFSKPSLCSFGLTGRHQQWLQKALLIVYRTPHHHHSKTHYSTY